MASSTRSTSAKHAASKRRQRDRQSSFRQHGVSLLLLLAVLAVLGGSLVVAVLSASQVQLERQRATTAALATAKRALIAYAASFADEHSASPPASSPYWVPGSLPCPELSAPTSASGEGRAASLPCGASTTNLLGKLPWAELGIEAVKDGAGQCLWYAVASTFKRKSTPPTTSMLNWDTPGSFDIEHADSSSATPVYLAGPDPTDRAVAVIFAPGAPLAGKSPTPHPNAPQCQGSYVASDYLDSADGVNNAATPSSTASFVVAEQSASFNDQLVYVTARDIFAEVERQQSFKTRIRRMMNHAADCISGFAKYHQTATPGDERLPWAMPLALTSIASYNTNSSYRDAIGQLSGRLAADVRRSCDSIRGVSCPTLERQLLGTGSLYCSSSLWSAEDDWWFQNWKDQLFYSVAFNHRPEAPTITAACPTCLKVNGTGNYAAVLSFAGRALQNLKRSTLADKSSIANYLEGRNASNHPNAAGDSNYQAGAASATFNDILVCIDDALNVIDPCPPGS